MKKSLIHNISFRVALSLLFLCTFQQETLRAQDQQRQLPGNPGETIELICDRSIYGVNEGIRYSANYHGPIESAGLTWSKVLYVELIRWDGAKQALSIVLIKNNRAEGEIIVPKNTPSGVYYLRAYTKWMRNYDPTYYAYIPLRILNPYSQELLGPPSTIDSFQLLEYTDGKIDEDITFSGLKEQYESCEHAEFEIQLQEELIPGRYTLSIAKTESLSSGAYSFAEKRTDKKPDSIEFLPEIEGLTLSGRIVDSETSVPTSGNKLQLSSYTNPFFFAEVSPAKDGSFIFTLPHFSIEPEFHLAEASNSPEDPEDHLVLLSPQFCNKPIRLPYVPLSIDTTEKEIVRELLVNMQLKERFGILAVSDRANDSNPSVPFYGSEAIITNVREYIELTDLREAINEIIPQVTIRSGDSGEYLSIQGPSCLDIYPPLVLMDNVPVANNTELLNIPSGRLKRIEVLNEAYMIGEFRYSGILSIFSNQNDMAGISLTGEHYFFDYQLLDSMLSMPEKQLDPCKSAHPNIRNQLYWESEIEFNEEGSFKVAFLTSEAPGQYVITLRSFEQENGPGHFKKELFSVK